MNMCGIGGFYNCTGGNTPMKALKSLWKGLEVRGRHASGFAVGWKDSDAPIVVKGAGPTLPLMHKLNRFAGGTTTQFVLLHNRYTTQGSVKNNANNHPVTEHGMVVTHNGVLWNDTQTLRTLGIDRVAEVDTEAINAGLHYKSPGWVLDNITGSMSIAWVDAGKSPDTVHLMTNGDNPLVIARTTKGDVVWCSTKSILDKSKFKIDEDRWFHATPFKVYSITPDGIIRSEIVSKQTAPADLGGPRYPKNPKWSRNTSNTTGGRQNARKGPKTTPALIVEVEDEEEEDWWDEPMIEAGFVKVWQRGEWRWVEETEVTL